MYCFNEGKSPEAIHEDFPLLKRAQIYGAIAFYLDHQPEIEEYLARTEREFEEDAIPLQEANPALWRKLRRARGKMASLALESAPPRGRRPQILHRPARSQYRPRIPLRK